MSVYIEYLFCCGHYLQNGHIKKGVMENIIDAHYFVLPSQGNVYSVTKLCVSNGANKILAASLRRKVFSFEYSGDSDGFLKPTVKEVLFTYIPSK